MRITNRSLALLLASALASTAWAAEIVVTPGDGTLAAAIAAASDGDTLVLQNGSYAGAVTVDKSLTIRAQSRSTDASVLGLTVQGDGISVTLQGLTFGGDVVLVQAAAVRLLENRFIGGGLNGGSYQTGEGDGSLMVIGNRFTDHGILNLYTENAYIAGNVIFNGEIHSNASAWVVGNEIHNAQNYAIYVGGAFARVIGNRLSCQSYGVSYCAQITSLVSLSANNVIELPDTSEASAEIQVGIYANNDATITNNVVTGTGYTTRQGPAIAASSSGARIAGNIIIDYGNIQTSPPISAPYLAQVTHNLCFNNNGDCPPGEGNLNVDPQFFDLVDFKLGPTSPAIDAGPPDYALADLDRSRNDMGVYGGPWSIDQYDAQRDPYNLTPYVYPFFKGDAGYSGGVLDVQAIGVARLR